MKTCLNYFVIAAALGSLAASNAAAQRSDSADAVAVLQRFHDALEKGDSTTALSLLTAT